MNDKQREFYLTLLMADRTAEALAFREQCEKAEKAGQEHNEGNEESTGSSSESD